jgi:glycine reductase complex component B subunit alpha and beta
MQLEVGSIHVDNLEFGARTALHDHTLVVDRDEIGRLVLEDPHFAAVDPHIVRPGDSVRIIHALDVVEPRWKVAGPGGVFPGFVSPPTTVGEGRTHRLAGVAVVEAGVPVPGEPTHFREQVIDMAGPGAPYSPFGSTLNLVLEFRPNMEFFAGAGEAEDVLGGTPAAAAYNRAMVHAGMRVAAHLGQLSREASPDEVETFALPPCDPGLSRVACLYQVYRPFIYGLPVSLPVGTVIHPNECFDGALAGWRQSYRCTYWDQNNAILQELCRRHGRDLQFVGCVLFGDITPYREEKERVSSAAVKLARLLGADAAVLLGLNGSNYAIDVMLALQGCEQAGIKTTLVYQDVGEGPDDPGFIFAVPEADAIVCTGSRDLPVTLPGLQRVIGGDHLVNPEQDARGEIRVPIRYLHSSCALQGFSRLSTRFE